MGANSARLFRQAGDPGHLPGVLLAQYLCAVQRNKSAVTPSQGDFRSRAAHVQAQSDGASVGRVGLHGDLTGAQHGVGILSGNLSGS